MARFCLAQGCPEIVDGKGSWCGGHDPNRDRPAWRGSSSSSSHANGWQWSHLKRRVKRRDNYRCVKCGAVGEQVDHIIPVARCVEAGVNPHTMENLQLLCRGCHKEKSDAEREEGKRRSREIRRGVR